MAFPTTGVLDAFTGADEDPITTNWTCPLFTGDENLRRLTNQLKHSATGTGWGNGYYDVSSFGPDCEVYTTISTVGGAGQDQYLYLRSTTGSVSGYEALLLNGVVSISRLDSNTPTLLGSTISQAFSAGDGFGMEAIGSTIKVYRRASGVWSEIGSRTDSTYTGAGRAGASIRSTTPIFDDFGGGTIPSDPVFAFDAAIESVRTDTSDPMTWTHTPVGTPKGVVVAFVHGVSATDHVSTVTYGGVAMAEVIRRTDTVTELGAAELWFLGSSIPTGAQTISADLASGTTDDIHGISWSLTSSGGNTEVIDSDGLAEDAANPTVTMNKGGRTGWSVAAMYGGGAAPGGTLSAGNTLSHTHDLGAFYSQSCYETTIDTADHTIGWSTLTSDDLAFVALCVAEVSAFVPRITVYVS